MSSTKTTKKGMKLEVTLWGGAETLLRSGEGVGFRAGAGEKMGTGDGIRGEERSGSTGMRGGEDGERRIRTGKGSGGGKEGFGSEVGFGMTVGSAAVLGEMQ